MSGTWADAGLRVVWTDFPELEADPIGDALRADMIAYWKLDEASGTRVDASGNGHNLTPVNTVTSAAGKIGNAAGTTIAGDGGLTRDDDAAFECWGLVDRTIFGWVKIDDFSVIGGDRTFLFSSGAANEGFGIHDYYLAFSDLVGNKIYVVISNADGNELAFVAHSVAPVQGEWTFFLATINAGAQTLSLRLNGVEETDSFFDITMPLELSNPSFSLTCEFTNGEVQHQMDGSVDEIGYVNRILTTEEKDYLYNGGAGRTLYS